MSAILDTYRSLYGLRRTSVLMPHIVISACTIYLIKLPSPSAGSHLAQLLNDLKAMSTNHPLTIRMLGIVLSLGKRWELDFPLEVHRAVGSLSPESGLPTLMGNYHYFPDPRDVQQNTPPPQQIQQARRESVIEAVMPTSNATSSPGFNATDFYWSPFLDQGIPLQAIQDGAMLDDRLNDWDQYQREGFKVVNVGDGLMGQPNIYDDWAQA